MSKMPRIVSILLLVAGVVMIVAGAVTYYIVQRELSDQGVVHELELGGGTLRADNLESKDFGATWTQHTEWYWPGSVDIADGSGIRITNISSYNGKDRFYVIGEGSFEVTQTDAAGAPRVLRQLGQDAVFGERGLIARAPRSATVTALTDGLLFTMDGSSFLELVGARSGVAERFMSLYDQPAVEPAARP